MTSKRPSPAEPLYYDLSQPLRPEDGLMYKLRDALVAVSQCVSERTDLTGSTLPQWLPLHKVHAHQIDTVAELARGCTLDTGAMTRLLDRLERKGLCRRVRSQSDRRVVHIRLTPAGVAVAERVPQILCEVYNQVLAGFSPAEWAQLQALLTRVTETAQALSANKDAS